MSQRRMSQRTETSNLKTLATLSLVALAALVGGCKKPAPVGANLQSGAPAALENGDRDAEWHAGKDFSVRFRGKIVYAPRFYAEADTSISSPKFVAYDLLKDREFVGANGKSYGYKTNLEIEVVDPKEDDAEIAILHDETHSIRFRALPTAECYPIGVGPISNCFRALDSAGNPVEKLRIRMISSILGSSDLTRLDEKQATEALQNWLNTTGASNQNGQIIRVVFQ